LAVALPLECIVLETDAPDIPPYWLAGARNEPAELSRIAQTMAELRGVSVQAVIAATNDSARRTLPRLDLLIAAAS
jgi:TatD DNase family protein